MDGNRLVAGITLGKIIPFQHASNGVRRRQLDHTSRAEWLKPGGIETNFRLVWIENLKHLFSIGLGVVENLLPGQWRTRSIASRWVADHASKVADQEHDMVSEFLKVA